MFKGFRLLLFEFASCLRVLVVFAIYVECLVLAVWLVEFVCYLVGY